MHDRADDDEAYQVGQVERHRAVTCSRESMTQFMRGTRLSVA